MLNFTTRKNLIILLFFLTAPAFGQSDSLSLSSTSATLGGTATMNLSLTSPAGSEPASAQWGLSYSPSAILSISAVAGPAATAAGKVVVCSASSGSYNCLLAGLNTNLIQDGVAAIVTVTLSPAVTNGTSILVTSPIASSATGNSIPVTGTGGTVTVTGGGPSTALVAAYSFDEGAGSTVYDASGNGNSGQISRATWTALGKFGSALVFDGSSARVNINDSASLHLTTGMTLEAWVNPSDVSTAWADIIYKGDDNYFLEGMSPTSALPVAGATLGDSNVVAYGTAALARTVWTHLTETYDGSTLRLYVNGVQVSSVPQAGNILTSANQLQIGGDSVYGQYFNGIIDEVRIYNVALTAAQIQNDMSTPVSTLPGVTAHAPSLLRLTRSAEKFVTPPLRSLGLEGRSREASLSCTPRTVNAGDQVTCELHATVMANDRQLTVASSSPQLKIPALVTMRQSQSSLSFRAFVEPSAHQQIATITVTSGATVAQDAILVVPSARPVLEVPARQMGKPGFDVSFKVSALDASGGAISISASSLPSGASFNPLTGNFHWIPEQSQVGSYDVRFTAVNSLLHLSSTKDVRIEIGSGKPTITAVVNGASQQEKLACSPGGIASVLGSWLLQDNTVRSDPSGKATRLGDTRVKVNGDYVPVLYASGPRVDFLCPPSSPGEPLRVELETGAGPTLAINASMQEAAPGIFSTDGSGQGQGLVLFPGTSAVATVRNALVPGEPAQPGDTLVIRATGPSRNGQFSVKLGDLNIPVQSVVAAAGRPGVYEVLVTVPAGSPIGDAVPVRLQLVRAGGEVIESNTVTIAVEAIRP